jgi:PKD repeat protein
MKPLLTIALLVNIFFAKAQNIKRCYTEEHYQEQLALHPELEKKREDFQNGINAIMAQQAANKFSGSQQLFTYVVPVVVHVIHQYGSENISDAQIEDQIRILNEDFQRTNSDSVNTPLGFRPNVGRMSIEFRLARKDPNGNCTNGIIRVVNSLTNGTSSFVNRDDVKSLSYWNANKYLNIWIVKNITPQTAGQTILGYAQFPGLGALSTEGLVLRSNATGSIGTAVGTNTNKGRTATHEIGHCLGLRHIWGDDFGTCTGSDMINDTPNQADENYNCPTFPQISCSNGPNGDMFMNYMDYVDDACMNMFSAGQVNVMNAVMNGTTGGRFNLWQAANLVNTGTDVPNTPIVCKPKPDYIVNKKEVCVGNTLTFFDKSWGTAGTSWSWTFQGGTPGTSNLQNPVIQYNTPGAYNVKLVVSNSAGTDSISKVGEILVKSAMANIQAPNYFETFPPNIDLTANSFRVVDLDNDLAFFPYTGAGIGDNSSVYMDNSINSPNRVDYLYMPNINFATAPTDAKLTFYVAYQKDNNTRNDKLNVQLSLNCGTTWLTKYTKTANSTTTPLATVTGINTSGNFVPTGALSWRKETVNITGLPGFATANNVEVRFVYTSDATIGSGLPLYIDSIAFTSLSSGLEKINETTLNAIVYPNPNEGKFTIELFDDKIVDLNINVSDLLGRKIALSPYELKRISNTNFELDLRNKIPKGVYLLNLTSNNKNYRTKLSILK